MTFNITTPNASQSPGLFPAQNNTNFSRLQSIINADHLFLNTAGATQGVHKQVNLINLSAVPTGLPVANSILYSLADANGQAQLNFYNGVQNNQLTPILTQFPIKVSGNVVVTKNNPALIFANPGYSYTGTLFAAQQNTNNWIYDIVSAWNGFSAQNSVVFLKSINGGSGIVPTYNPASGDLSLTDTIGPATLTYSLIINRLS